MPGAEMEGYVCRDETRWIGTVGSIDPTYPPLRGQCPDHDGHELEGPARHHSRDEGGVQLQAVLGLQEVKRGFGGWEGGLYQGFTGWMGFPVRTAISQCLLEPPGVPSVASREKL